MKFSKSLLAVIAMAGTMGFSAVASAMDFTVYGSLRGGLSQTDTDDYQADRATTVGLTNRLVQAISNAATVADLEALGLDEDAIAELDPTDDGTAITATEVAALTPVTVIEFFDIADSFGVDAAGAPVDVEATNAFDATDIHVEGAKTEVRDAQLVLGHDVGAASRIGIRGSEDLGNGASAGLQWETLVGAAGETTSGRLANVWYEGAFGKVTIGQQGNPYRNVANWDQSFYVGGQARTADGGARLQGVRYDGSAGAFNFSVMATANDEGEANSVSAALTETVFAQGDVGANGDAGYAFGSIEYAETEAETGIDSWIATGHYDMGVATINLGYRVDNNETQLVGAGYDNFGISANGTLDALDWFIAYDSSTDNTNAKKGEISLIGEENAGTAIDAGDVTANTNLQRVVDARSTAQDTTTIGLFLNYNISEVSQVYLEWEDTSNDGLDYAGDNLGTTATLLGFGRKIGPNTQFIAEYVTIDHNSEIGEDNADSSVLVGTLKVDF